MAILSLWLRLLSCTIPATPRHPGRSPRGPASRFRPAVENLEGRLVPSTVRWTNPAGGDWADATNWNTGAVPGPDDDVVIDVPGNVTITHATGDDSVHSLMSRDPLDISGGSLALADASTFGALNLSGGTLTGTAEITVNGLLHWTAGTLAGVPGRYGFPWLAARGGLTIDGPDQKLLDGREIDLRSNGRISDGPLTLQDARLDNLAGNILQLNGAMVQEAHVWSSSVANEGELRVFNGAMLATSHFANAGNIEIFQGWLVNPVPTASVASSGTIHVWDGAGGLDMQVGHFDETGSISGPGNVRIGSDDAMNFRGEFHVDGSASFSSHSYAQYGDFVFGMPDFYVGRALTFTDTHFEFTGTVEARTLTVARSSGGLYQASVAVGLEVDVQGSSLYLLSADLRTNTLMVNDAVYSSQLTLAGSAITARTLINQSSLWFFGRGDSAITTTEKVYNRGTLHGYGTIVGDLVNEGTVSVGDPVYSGQLTITGDFTQTATGVLDLRIGAANPDMPNDLLVVGGTARLDGTLSVALMDGYVPSAGDTFQGISFAAQSGDFATYNLPDLGNGMYLQASSDGSSYYFIVQSNT